MKELGIKVVKLNLRVNRLNQILELPTIQFMPRFSSDYYNLLVNQVNQLYISVNRLEKTLGLQANFKKSDAMLNNIALKINALCQRIVRIEKIVL